MLAPPKRLFRELARRVYGPRVANAKKQGFSVPVHTWLRGRARALVGDLLSPASISAVPVLDPGAVSRVRDRFLGGEQLGFEIWGLLVLVAWYRARIAKPPALAELGADGDARRGRGARGPRPATTLRRFEL